MTQKGDLYIKLFSTLHGVRYFLEFCQRNILCTSLAKRILTINNELPLFTVHILRPINNTEFRHSGVIHTSKRFVPYQE